jgi:tRNA/rRNA methyltransferase
MPGAGTDKTKDWHERPGPVIVLVEPQLGENIGAAARAMANFGLSQLRLVAPKVPWPNERARVMASGADRVLDGVEVFDSFAAAIADCTFVLATTARAHDQAKPVIAPQDAARQMAVRVGAGEQVAIVFGRERIGLVNEEVAAADAIVTFPVNPAFASLNLAQAVLLVAYEWFKAADGALPFSMPQKSAPAPKQQLQAFLDNVERALDSVEFFRPEEKRATMKINLQNIFARMQPTRQDIQTLSGVIMSIAEGRKGPARGGVLDSAEAEKLRAFIAEQGEGGVAPERVPVRGLAKLLRRNPTDAERALWNVLTKDRRFAAFGFKRQVPVGPHIVDLVSFAQRVVIDIVPAQESPEAARTRASKRAWLTERGYRVHDIVADEALRDPFGSVDRLAEMICDN